MPKKNYNIPIVLLILVLGIVYLSYYNYKTQKDLLLIQMQNNSSNIVSSVSAAIGRFNDIKSTMSLQKLLDEVSFELEIFEFRYLDSDGTIRNSMFKDEIGNIYTSEIFTKIMQGDYDLKKFFFEVRDYVNVMAIYYPIYKNNDLIGIIDLAVDIDEYKMLKNSKESFSMLRRQVDIMNLLKSIEGSISNSIAIAKKTDIHTFLQSYASSTQNIKQISLVNENREIFASSDKREVGRKLNPQECSPSSLILKDGHLVHRTIVKETSYDANSDVRLLFLIDATNYVSHEQQLLKTAVLSSVVALFFALFTSWAIYYSTLQNSRKEKERLELLVKERTKEIEKLSKTDALTGLWNRGYLEEMLEMEFKRAKRNKEDISIIFIDLDHFKNINDTYGHQAGDEVLRTASIKIKESLRETDFVGRYGGEEIVVILPEANSEEATKIAEQIRVKLATEPIVFQEHSIPVTASFGVSHLRHEHENHLMLFAEADEALYSAKELGRNRVEVYKG